MKQNKKQKKKKKHEKQNKYREKTKEFLNFLENNKLFLAIFIITTTYFVYENIISLSWDFSVYILNAKYYFAESTYFEVGRPPIASLIMGILGIIIGWRLAEILFVIITATLFAYAIYKLSQTLKFDPATLYALSMNTFVITYALAVGTELLSLAFLIIATTMIIKNNATSGIFLGISALARYNALGMFPMLLFHFNTKKIIKSLILFGIVIASWLTYNYFAFGNAFESIANLYSMNIINRQDIAQPFNIMHIIKSINILMPLFLIGLFKVIINTTKDIIKHNKTKKIIQEIKNKKTELLMLAILIYTIYNYATTPLKIARYLFFITLPIIYFSYIGLETIIQKVKNKKIIQRTIATTLFIISMIAILTIAQPYYDEPRPYEETKTILEELNLTNCYIESNIYPQLNYLEITSAVFPRQELIERNIDDGSIMVFFKSAGEPEYVRDEEFMKSLPIIKENERLYIIGKEKCAQKEPYTRSYLQEIYDYVLKQHDYEININPCFIMFQKYSILEKTCNFAHGKGFKIDENRETII